MRKFAASLLSLVLLLSLTACGSAGTKQQENMQAELQKVAQVKERRSI